MRLRLQFTEVVFLLAMTSMWLAAYVDRSPSLIAAFDLNLAPLGSSEPNAPLEFRSTQPVQFTFEKSGTLVHLSYKDGPDFYRTAYKDGWSQCLRYYLYPSKASWRYSEASFPWVTDTLPAEFSRDHIARARRDGFKACSDRIESLLASDPNLHSRLLIPASRRFFWPSAISLALVGLLVLRRILHKGRNNKHMHRNAVGASIRN